MAFYIPYMNRPPDLRNNACFVVFARNILAPWPGNAYHEKPKGRISAYIRIAAAQGTIASKGEASP